MKLRFLLTKYADRMQQAEEKSTKSKAEAKSQPATAQEDIAAYPPYNFSWLDENKVAGMGWPKSVENLNYLVEIGIDHLVTLSPERVPPILELPTHRRLKWTEIPIKEFTAPTLKQILQFIGICERAKLRGEVVGVHCRQGRGRTGTMLAAYLVHSRNMAPERAVMTVRVQRPGSCETYQQEKSVCHYHDCLRGTTDTIDYLLADSKDYFDRNLNQSDDYKPRGLPKELAELEKVEEKDEPAKKTKSMVINHKIYF